MTSSSSPPPSAPSRPALRITLIYALVAGVWILFSDHIIAMVGGNLRTITFLSVIKGWLFIAVTAALLHHLMQKCFDGLENSRQVMALSEERFQLALQGARDGLWDWNLRTDEVYFSPGWKSMLGWADGELENRFETWKHLLHPDDLEVTLQAVDDFLAGRTGQYEVEFRLRHRDGHYVDVLSRARKALDAGGKPVRLVGTHVDITGRKQAEAALREKGAELERFTYMVSHDLRSPLLTVKTFLGFLEEDMARGDAGKIGQDLHYMRSATEKMGRLLDDLLEMSRIGRLLNPPELIAFRELAEEALGTVAGGIASRGVVVRVNESRIILRGDRPHLLVIWQNLLENAVKFMGEQPSPRVEIGAEGTGAETVFFVCDNGIGIDPRFQEKVFGPFEKLDPRSEGTGLGLALAKRVVELYEGRIWLESAGSGHGACFRFTLPGAFEAAMKGEMS